jgi:DNA repair protein RadD
VSEYRDYQAQDSYKIQQAFARGVRRILYVLPTGGGKTFVFCKKAQEASALAQRTAILVHRQELLRQSSLSLGENNVPHGMIAPGYTPNRNHIQVASVQTLVRRLTDMLPFDFIVVDEAHHATAATWRKIFEANPNALILGVTATPIRSDGSGLGGIFEEMIVGPSIAQLMEEGYLCKARVYAPPTQYNLDGIGFRGGDFARDELALRVDKPAIIGDVVEHYRKLCAGLPAIDFCVNIKHANHSAERFNAAGFRWRVLDGTMTDEYREETIRFLAQGRIDGISSCDLISEGTDIPVASVAICQRHTASTGLHMQQVGRVLRPVYARGFDLKTQHGRLAAIAASNKPFAFVLDHVGNTIRHGQPDAERLWGLFTEKKKPTIIPRYEEEEDRPVRRCPKCFAMHKPAKQCPYCKHEYITETDLPNMEKGELVEHTRNALEFMLKNYKTLSDYKKLAKANGYEETWAHACFKRQNDRMKEYKKVMFENKEPIRAELINEKLYPTLAL